MRFNFASISANLYDATVRHRTHGKILERRKYRRRNAQPVSRGRKISRGGRYSRYILLPSHKKEREREREKKRKKRHAAYNEYQNFVRIKINVVTEMLCRDVSSKRPSGRCSSSSTTEDSIRKDSINLQSSGRKASYQQQHGLECSNEY